MKQVLLILVLVVSGYLAYRELKPPPPPPPPPLPPPTVIKPQPIIDAAQQAKIIKATDDPDPQVRWEALVLLDKMNSPQALPLLFSKLQKDSDPGLRKKIIQLLSKRKDREVTQNIIWALKDPEPTVRVEALDALDKIGDYSAAPAITECLKDEEESVRTKALKTLNSLQDKKTAEILAEQRRQEELRRQKAARGK
ncbi:MAG: HEAT repeat domain-containing protein [Elusimicrobia bacterium]|nr:HEAT repeat domain-containing protein [Elusimicrobiota bacterium]MDE2237636.1 HEAT repeat domain-containing protein [Elusimicrobiota bacterium]MDE2425869.1 HEAT repeat domain-containing protein [Elusimicrobiota bacterium]